MSSDYNNPAFKKLLQRLQEDSWQLELIISGFAVLGLFSAYEPLKIMSRKAQNDDQFFLNTVIIIALISCSILMFNLLLHVILRGLWIGALGLRYVSGDIDYDALKYSTKFTKYLKKRVGSFDRYINTLENYCSIIFAISFLLIFYVLALMFTSLTIALIAKFLIANDSLGTLGKIIGIPLVLFLTLGMFFTFLDFATQGWLKKKKWTSVWYFPIYWLFSFITFSFLYRPLVYNFLDNKFGRRLSFLLVPLYFGILVIFSLKHQKSNYFDFASDSSSIIADSSNYEDLLIEEGDLVENIAIPSKVITTPYLKVFILFDEDIEDNVFDFNPSLKPEHDERGLYSDMFKISKMSVKKRDNLRLVYLNTLNSIYKIKIDTLEFKSEFVLGKSIKDQNGLESYLGIKNLKEGKHLLNISQKYVEKGDTLEDILATIPFWHYKD